MNDDKIISKFTSACIKHGFSKKGRVFSRCIGNAIYQNLSIDMSDCVTANSSEGFHARRKVPFIRIGIWSMYSNLPSFYFTDRKHIGSFYPENLKGTRFDARAFMGIHGELEIMLSTGFDFLNSITTQERLIEITHTLQYVQHGFVLPHQLELCAPYILCNKYAEALNHLYGIYAQNWLNFHAKYDNYKNSGLFDEYIKRENDFESEMHHITSLLYNILGQKKEEINAYLCTCLRENVRLAQENNIAFSDNFHLDVL